MTASSESSWSDESLNLIRARYAAPMDRRRPTRGELAAMNGTIAGALVPAAAELAGKVRDEGADSIAGFLAAYTVPELRALCIVLAAMVPDDKTPRELLDWVTWDEFGRPLPANAELVIATGRKPPRTFRLADIPACGTREAAERHLRYREPLDDDCRAAYNTWQRAGRPRREDSDAA